MKKLTETQVAQLKHRMARVTAARTFGAEDRARVALDLYIERLLDRGYDYNEIISLIHP